MQRLLKKYWIEALSILVVLVSFAFIGERVNLVDLLGKYGQHMLVVILAGAIVSAVYIFRARKLFWMLYSMRQHVDEDLNKPVTLFLLNKLSEADSQIKQLGSPEGVTLTIKELDKLVDACFAANHGRKYLGTDSHIPSEFYKIYHSYLDNQAQSDIRGENPRPQSYRFLLVSETALHEDYTSNQPHFERFLHWHPNNYTRLIQVLPHIAEGHKDAHGLPATDIGVFSKNKFVLFFAPMTRKGKTHSVHVTMRHLDEDLRSGLREYLSGLNENGRYVNIDTRTKTLSFVEREDREKNEDLEAILIDW